MPLQRIATARRWLGQSGWPAVLTLAAPLAPPWVLLLSLLLQPPVLLPPSLGRSSSGLLFAAAVDIKDIDCKPAA